MVEEQEITDLEELHQQMSLLGSIDVGLVVINRDFEVRTYNEFMHHHSGILPADIRGQSLFTFFPEIEEKWFRRKAEPVFRLNTPAFMISDQRPYLFEFKGYRPVTGSGSYMYQNITLFPLVSLSGLVDHLCIVVYDVTDVVISKQRLAIANKQLEKMSRIDGLTGLYNRRFWEESCIQEFKRCHRSGHTSSLLILDIDHFKKVNDNYGHPAGDQVIKALAAIIKQQVRETDIPGRYGGEEFTIILPDTNRDDAAKVAERIRKVAENTSVVNDGVEINFTISLGLSAFDQSFKDYVAWLDYSDQGLYKAKEGGRNQLVVR